MAAILQTDVNGFAAIGVVVWVGTSAHRELDVVQGAHVVRLLVNSTACTGTCSWKCQERFRGITG
jgi:hypothetical protein